MKGKRSYGILYGYMLKSFLGAFLVSFAFFFFIFFANQILVLAQKILIKNVSIKNVLLAVIYSIPQFLLYTFPFSCLTAASMVIGELSSKNEILAMRFSGIHIRHVFLPIIIASIALSAMTLIVTNNLVPYTAGKYRALYSQILRDLPTMELKANSVNKVGSYIIKCSKVEGSVIHDLLIIDNSDPSRSTTITSKQGTLSLVDINAYVYRLDLEDATLAETSAKLNRQYSLSSARSMTLYLDFSASVSSSASTTPSQMSLRQIKAAMDENEKAYESQRSATLSQGISSYKEYLRLMEECRQGETIDYNLAYNLFTSYQAIAKSIQQGFTSKYYESEYNKKLALSMACTFLIFMAFPLSFSKIRYGRLLGFGLSIFSCAAYWFMLFYAQVLCLRVNISPAFLIWAPNAFFLLVGTILLIRLARS